MAEYSTATESIKRLDGAAPLCWICKHNEANSGEHKTKRSDLLAVLGNPTQEEPFYYHDLERRNRPVKSLDAKILKAPIRICAECNSARTQPHDRAWEQMSKWLRERQQPVKVGGLVRGNRIFLALKHWATIGTMDRVWMSSAKWQLPAREDLR